MGKNIVLVLVIMVLTSLFVFVFPSEHVKAAGNIVYVDDSQNENWYNETQVRTIQEGITNVTEGGTVYVYNGTYTGNIVINKSLNLIGENEEATSIEVDELSTVVSFTEHTKYVTITKFTIKPNIDPYDYSIIKLDNNSYINISNCNISGGKNGINLSKSSNNTISNCYIHNNTDYGIYSESSSNDNNITGNQIYNNSYCGIYLTSSSNNKITSNQIHKNTNWGGIFLYTASNNTIWENQIYNNTKFGIYIFLNSNNNIIASNQIYNNTYHGIRVSSSSNSNTINSNHIYNNPNGTYVDVSDNNNIIGNQIYNNTDCGICLYDSSNNNIIRNQIHNNTNRGINICNPNSKNSLVYHNDFIDNTAYDEGDNAWDDGYPSGGNYWNDFDEPSEDAYDNNSDGIVDSPYNIPGLSNQDLYPLTGPWGERPNQPTLIQPSNGATDVSTSPTLKVTVTDPNDDTMSVSFYSSTGGNIGSTVTGVSSGGTASVTWSGLSYSTLYKWYVIVSDDTYNTRSVNWSFTTTSAPPNSGGDDTNIAPSAEAGGPYPGYVNSTITFDGSGSKDPDGTIIGYRWDFENDGTYNTGWLTTATTTHSYPSTGVYTVKLQVKDNEDATATDTATATISEAPPKDNPPVISNIQHNPKEITNIDIVTISATVTDDYGITSVNLHWNDGTEHTKTMSKVADDIYTTTIGPFSAGTIRYSVIATDIAGKTTQSSSYIFNVATVIVVGNVSSDETSNITSDELKETGFKKVSFTTKTDIYNVKIKIEKLANLTEKIPDILYIKYQDNGNVYNYYNITITSNDIEINESDIESGIITIEISKNWFRENNVSNNSVVMFRYHNNTWNNLTTTHLEIENETFEFYEVLTPGFSTFAVVGSKIIETKPIGKQEGLPWMLIFVFIILSVVVLVAVLFKARYIYVKKDDQEKKYNKDYKQESKDENVVFEVIQENKEENK